MRRTLGSARAAHRTLVRILAPRTLRAEYADEMESTFRAQVDSAPNRRAVWTLLAREIVHLVAAHRDTGAIAEPQVRRFRLEPVIADTRIALRGLRRSPGFALVATGVLALGIGANTLFYTVVDEILLRPLPVADQSSLVDVKASAPGGNGFLGFSHIDFEALRDGSTTLGDLAAFAGLRLRIGDRGTEQITATLATPGYFELLGVGAAAGRTELPPFSGFGTPPVAVLSHAFWQRRFGGDPGIVGSTLEIEGRPVEVIGIAAAPFTGTFIGFPVDAWLPVGAAVPFMTGFDGEDPGAKPFELIGRLRPGVTPAAARADLDRVAEELERRFPEENRALRTDVSPLTGIDHSIRAGVLGFLGLLGTVAFLVLVVACLNVGAILLVRAMAREREMAIRLAVGAGGWALARQLLIESALLVAIGCAGALMLSVQLTGALRRYMLTFWGGLGFDFPLEWRPLALTASLALLATLVAGLAPVLHVFRGPRAHALRGRSGSRAAGTARRLLVASQVALSVVLVITTGLFVRAFQEGLRADHGYDVDRVVAFPLTLPEDRWTEADGRALQRRVARAVLSAPGGASHVSLSPAAPVGVARSPLEIGVDGWDPPGDADGFVVDVKTVGPGFLETVGIALRSGRDFVEADAETGPPVAVVSAAFHDRFWPAEAAVGRTLTVRGRSVRVVGVAEDVRYLVQDDTPDPLVYLAPAGAYFPRLQVLARVSDAATSVPVLRDAVAGLGAELPAVEPRTLREMLTRSLLPQRAGATLIGVMGSLALLLAAVGLYGLIQHSVSRRTQELGVRLALGAGRWEVAGAAVRDGLFTALAGVAAGVALSLLAAPALGGFLVGVSPWDIPTYLTVALTFAVVALVAGTVPARRATRISPSRALRAE